MPLEYFPIVPECCLGNQYLYAVVDDGETQNADPFRPSGLLVEDGQFDFFLSGYRPCDWCARAEGRIDVRPFLFLKRRESPVQRFDIQPEKFLTGFRTGGSGVQCRLLWYLAATSAFQERFGFLRFKMFRLFCRRGILPSRHRFIVRALGLHPLSAKSVFTALR